MPPADATRSVALLGPTNTGKTHRAVERMLEHDSGMIGLPLRLLAREVYDRLTPRVGEDRVALVTGEEKRVPRRPDYWVCTTEAMPLGRDVDFLAVDEIQLATHEERGHVFTDRLLGARGRRESWFLGAATMRPVLERLVPAARYEEQPRFSKLSFTGGSKLSRLKPRSAVVAFSVNELYALAGKLKRLHGGTAVVLGALSPRTRNAQVALFQSGEVDYLVATDAIGMGLNLDVDHVAFAALRKFDGKGARALHDAEIAQIAGRAGRYTRDGSFGTLLPVELDRDVAARVEAHRFEPVRRVRYRSSDLDFSSAEALIASLRAPARQPYLASAAAGDDLLALIALCARPELASARRGEAALRLLWDVCQIPDFRKLLFELHVELLGQIFAELVKGPLGDAFIAGRVAELDRADGDVDTLTARIARLRTWAFVANQSRWLEHPERWQAELGALEDRLSDALHTSLVERFVDRRARLARPAHKRARHEAAVDPSAPADAYRPFAALDALRERLSPSAPAPDPGRGLELLCDAPHEAFSLGPNGEIRAGEARLGRLAAGASASAPGVRLIELEGAGPGVRSRLERRLAAFARDAVGRLLQPIRELARSDVGALRAVAYQLERGLGTARRGELEGSLGELGAEARARLTELGIEIRELTVLVPALLRGRALAQRGALIAAYHPRLAVPDDLGRPVLPVAAIAPAVWLSLGYVALGPCALRADLAERAAAALIAGASPLPVLAALGVARNDRPKVARALAALLAPRAA